MDVEKVSVWSFPAFDACGNGWSLPDKLTPQSLRVRAGDPPGGAVTERTVAHADKSKPLIGDALSEKHGVNDDLVSV